MEDSLTKWLYDPAVGKLVASAIGVLVIVVAVRIVQRSLGRFIRDTDVRYRARTPWRQSLILGLNVWPITMTEFQVNYLVDTDNQAFENHQLLVNFQLGF